MVKRLIVFTVALCAVAGIAAATSVTPTSYAATGARGPRKSPTNVTVIEQRKLPKGARTIIELKKGASHLATIYVDPSVATPADLAESFNAINRLKARFGDTLSADLQAFPKGGSVRKPSRGRNAQLHRMKKYMDALSHSSTRDIPGIGRRKAITVMLAAKK